MSAADKWAGGRARARARRSSSLMVRRDCRSRRSRMRSSIGIWAAAYLLSTSLLTWAGNRRGHRTLLRWSPGGTFVDLACAAVATAWRSRPQKRVTGMWERAVYAERTCARPARRPGAGTRTRRLRSRKWPRPGGARQGQDPRVEVAGGHTVAPEPDAAEREMRPVLAAAG